MYKIYLVLYVSLELALILTVRRFQISTTIQMKNNKLRMSTIILSIGVETWLKSVIIRATRHNGKLKSFS